MDEAKRKVWDDAEKEILGFCGGNTDYQTWLGDSERKLVPKIAALKKMFDTAEEQRLPVSSEQKKQFEQLQLFKDILTMAISEITELGAMMESSIGQAMPLSEFAGLAIRYVGAHRVAHALWRNRDDSRPPLPRPADPGIN